MGVERMVVVVANEREIALSGRLDVSSASDVRAALHEAIDLGPATWSSTSPGSS